MADFVTYLGPRIRRLRRDLGLTQAEMAADLEISPSYVALIERNHRPVTAEILLRLARAYKVDFSDLSEGTQEELQTKLRTAFRDPLLADVEISASELGDVANSFPTFAEAFIRLHTTYREEQLALAEKRQDRPGASASTSSDPVAAVRNFLAARKNCFPALDSASETLAAKITEEGGFAAYLKKRHNLIVRRLPSDVMVGSVRRLDWHRKAVLLDETLDVASQNFQLAQQLAYLEFEPQIAQAVEEGNFPNDNTRRLATRTLAAYCAAAILMPYARFAKSVDTRRYDIEGLAREFGTSFEQVAHRLTTLQKPGQERVPFFFIRVDTAGNVSKRLNSGSFPFARHGGGCPLWTVHQTFKMPRQIVTQWLELPDGQRFFSVARTVYSGGGSYRALSVERSVALVCEAKYADRLVYSDGQQNVAPTPIGIACHLCHRITCTARSEPPIGRQLLPDNFRRTDTPFGFSDS